ncbi:TPA: BrnA antitoxin family protein [Klebsiella quasipneumoniae subsp. quasipneumoniae]
MNKTKGCLIANFATVPPYLPDAVWMKAAEQLPHTKKQITLRIDAEVLEFFKHTGKRYQSRMNAVLRSYVEAHKAHAK